MGPVLAAAVGDALWVAPRDVVLMPAGAVIRRTPASDYRVVTWTKDLDGLELPAGHCLAVKADTVTTTLDYGQEHFDAKVREYWLGAHFDAFVDSHDDQPRVIPLNVATDALFPG